MKCLPHKHEDPSSILRIHFRVLGAVAHACHSTVGKWRQEHPLGFLSSQSSSPLSSQPVGDPVSKKMGGISEGDTQDCPLIYTYILKRKL